MLFSSPDYPLFLIAVFALYALSRFGGAAGRVARVALMVWLGDLVFVLVAKDPDLVWDPIGNVLLRAVAGATDSGAWPIATLAWHWAVGTVVLGGALAVGFRGGARLATERSSAPDRPRARGGRRGDRARRSGSRRVAACSTWSAPGSRSMATCSCSPCSASRSAPRRSTPIVRSAALLDPVRRVELVLPGVGGRDAGGVSLPARAVAGHDRPRFLPRDLDRGCRLAGRAQGAPDRVAVLEPRHPVRLQVHRLRHARRAAPVRAPAESDPAGRHLVPHVPVAVVHDRRLSQAAARDALADPVRDVRVVLPAAGRRADRARAGAVAAARDPPALELEQATRGLWRIVVGLVQEDRARRHPRDLDRRPRVRGAGALLELGGPRRRVRLRAADLLRLLGVLRHRDRLGRSTRLHAARELSHAVSQREPPGVLAALAHLAVDVAARLSLHLARR